MRVPLSWLKEYVDIDRSPEELGTLLTMAGLELDAVEQVGDWWDAETVLVGQVVAVLPHPDADRLVLVDVDYGAGAPQRVVTGAPNLFAFRGQSRADDTLPILKVAFARAGSELIDPYTDERPRPKKKLKPSKIRGIESAGMVCSELELGLSEAHEGILLLPDDAPVGAPLREYLGDVVLDFEMTPDMARCLNLIGIAREAAALTDAALHLPADDWSPTGDDTAADYLDVRIDNPALCNRYTGTMIVGVTVGDSPKWMQDRLRKAGMRPINNVVDITNYVMLEWGQPLHAFDYDILAARAERHGDAKPTIIVRTAIEGEEFTTLDHVQRRLDASMLMIADTAGSVAIAGVMGGLESEVGDDTRNILLESATFEGINNRRTAGKLRLPSAASYRFARSIPAELNDIAARRAAELLRKYAGGRIVPGMVDAYPVPQPSILAYTTVRDVRRILGLDLSQADIESALARLEIETEPVKEVAADAPAEATFALAHQPGDTLLACTPPWYRLDVRIPADLAEEVARIVGYDKVGMTLLQEELPPQRYDNVHETEERIRNILVNIGLQETITRALTSPEDHAKLALEPADRPFIEIANPNSPEYRVMQRSLLVNALNNLARNLRYTDRMATFEIGRVYLPEAVKGPLPKEERRFCLTLCGPRHPLDFYHTDENEEMDFFDLKGMIETLLERLGFKPEAITFRAVPDTRTFGPRCAEVYVDDQCLGLMGELHPEVRAAFNLPNIRINAAELTLEALIMPHWNLDPMRPISSYPPVVEDLAFEVAEQVTAQDVHNAIHSGGDARLVDVELFDVYRGEPLAPGNKSLAYRLTYQSMDRSMNEKEISHLRRRIVTAVEKATQGKLRS